MYSDDVKQGESILHTEENKRKDSFIMKKLALLIPGCNPHNNGKSYEDKILYGGSIL